MSGGHICNGPINYKSTKSEGIENRAHAEN